MAGRAQPVRTVAILGAGCAGTLLAAELCRVRFAGRVEIVDVRADFTREQRWCFWRGRGEAGFDGLPVDTEWPVWQVTDERQTVRRLAASYVYSHVHAPEFFRRFHGRLADESHVGMHLGCRVSAVEKNARGTHRVQTNCGELLADVVIDARHEEASAYEQATANAAGLLWQTFRGRVVEFAAPCFDPGTANLMDFRLPAVDGGLAFAYVLPFSTTRALVEAVVLGPRRASSPQLDALLDVYLQERIAEKGETLAVEAGVLPMTTRPFTRQAADESICLGVGGGAARPSSGYAFANMVRAMRQTAAALCAGQPLQQPGLAWKYRGLDALFLRLLATKPVAARRAFMAMFTKVEPGRLVRFLTEASSWYDDMMLGLALPKIALLRAVCTPVRSTTNMVNAEQRRAA